jgi:hypothetical protein
MSSIFVDYQEDDGEDGSNEIDDLVECVVCMDEFTKVCYTGESAGCREEGGRELFSWLTLPHVAFLNGVLTDRFQLEWQENPSVRTLCGCGENKSLFHLGCLYEWLDRQPNCPTCRQEIFFEEAMFRVES